MSESICRFMSAKSEDSTIQAVRFVYETECHSLKQPFLHPIYVFHIVIKGSAVFRIGSKSFNLKRGDVFSLFRPFRTIWMPMTTLNIFISALWETERFPVFPSAI